MKTSRARTIRWAVAATAVVATLAAAWLMPRDSPTAGRHEARVVSSRCALVLGPAHDFCPQHHRADNRNAPVAVDVPRLGLPVRISVLPWIAAILATAAAAVWAAERRNR